MGVDTIRTVERRFRAMGSDCHLMIVGGDADASGRAVARIEELESRWSRFIPTSEVCQLNDNAGTPMLVSDDTVLLAEKARMAHRLTNGRFDATVLGDVIRSGYDRPFDRLPSRPHAVSDLIRGPITVIGPTVALGPGTGFDPGGIGKGLAADIVARETIEGGAGGVCVNMGGDVRVAGIGPDDGGWSIAIEHPDLSAPLATVGIRAGAVATSTRLIRRWMSEDGPRHHLIDPRTGEPTDSDLTLVTVIASQAWVAETHAKASLLAGSDRWTEPLRSSGMEALAVTEKGTVLATPGLSRFTTQTPINRIERGVTP